MTMRVPLPLLNLDGRDGIFDHSGWKSPGRVQISDVNSLPMRESIGDLPNYMSKHKEKMTES